MKIRKIHILIIAILLAINILAKIAFKIHYSKAEIYNIQDFMVDSSKIIENGVIVIGKNIKGKLEASIFPDNGIVKNGTSYLEVDYIYLRFYPEWFESHIKPALTESSDQDYKVLVQNAKKIHDRHFKNFMHINDFPIIKEDYTPIIIKFKGSDKIQIIEPK